MTYPARPSEGYPIQRNARQAERDRIRERVLGSAERQIARAGRSLTCGQYDRHTTCAGAVFCICECHDEPLEDA